MAKAKSTCAADGCDRGVYCREMCSMHYNRWRKQAKPEDLRRWQARPGECAVPGCDSTNMVNGYRGYCSMHYQRVMKTGSPGDPAAKVSASKRVEQSDGSFWRLCPGCEVAKPDDSYYKKTGGRLSYYCKTCATLAAKELRSRDPDKFRARQREWYRRNLEANRLASVERYRKDPVRAKLTQWRSQGIDVSAEDYHRMHAEQGGRCAICHLSEAENGKALALDHCHTTNRVRGLLCDLCNTGLGRFKDSPDALRRAITYLEASS